MPISFSQFPLRTLPLSAALLCLVCFARGAQAPTPGRPGPAGRAQAATNAAPAALELPKSVFHIPTSPQDAAKDPFFPQSTRLHSKPVAVVSATNAPPPVVIELGLKGVSGTADRRFAIINSRTFATGEEGDVPVGGGRAHIRVVEIKADSVVVLVNGEQRVLKLRSGL
jgi:hypothetical protein